jgi:hypothetical protein
LRQDLDSGDRTYLGALSDLVIVYELEHYPMRPLPPHELLAQMLKELNMSLSRTNSICVSFPLAQGDRQKDLTGRRNADKTTQKALDPLHARRRGGSHLSVNSRTVRFAALRLCASSSVDVSG